MSTLPAPNGYRRSRPDDRPEDRVAGPREARPEDPPAAGAETCGAGRLTAGDGADRVAGREGRTTGAGRLMARGVETLGRAGEACTPGNTGTDRVTDLEPVRDGGRVIAEGGREFTEGGRVIAEGGRVFTEGGRVMTEGGRVFTEGGGV